MATDFDIAYRRARDRFSDEEWHRLAAPERAGAIYKELRRLDAERLPDEARQRADKRLFRKREPK